MIKEANSTYYVFLDEVDDIHDTFIQDVILKWSKPRKNAIVMACNSKYCKSCLQLTLITSLFKYSDNDIDKIYVFDVWLLKEKQHVLMNIQKVQVISIGALEIIDYTLPIRVNVHVFLMPDQFAWKPWFIRYVFEHTDTIQNIFWIDSEVLIKIED